jgi:hypothetical protein
MGHQKNGNGAHWAPAGKMRGHTDAAESVPGGV